MPFVEGESVRVRLAKGPLAIGEAISILRDVARALAFAHANGVVHRDIKPDNVLLAAGSATVTDFGIAKAISASRTVAPGGTLTVAGTSIGTPAYMAPEQAAGDPDTDHRADFYSFGILAYELLCGQTPFQGLAPSRMLAAKLSEKPRDIRELRPDTPLALAQIVMRCLESDPANRPQNGTDIVKVLDTVTSSSSSEATPIILAGGQIRLGRAIAMWAGATLLVALTAWAATAVIGLPEWVLPGSAGVMLLGLPMIFLTAYVQRTAYRAYTTTPAFTPGGTSTTSHGTMAGLAIKASPHMSWRRTWIGGAVAVGAFAALVLAFMVMRALGIGPAGSLIGKGAFGAKDMIVVADFKSPPSDSSLGGTAAEALRTDLAQSTSLKVLTRAAVTEDLRLMQLKADARVGYELAREIASREGAKAVLDGEITQLGASYVVAARLVNAQTGDELASFRRTASNVNELVAALGALSKDVRSKVGESLRNVRETNPLERVTTSSLPALKKYVEGLELISETGDNARGRVPLLEAVRLDSTFAMAWRRLAATYGNQPGTQGDAQHAISEAFKHRDHLSEEERLLTEAGYYDWGPLPDHERAIAAYESVIERDSTNPSAVNNVGNLYQEKRDFARAEERFTRASYLPHPFGGAFSNLIQAQVAEGKTAAAESTLVRFRKALPTHGEIAADEGVVLAARGRYGAADSTLRAALPALKAEDPRAYAAWVDEGVDMLRGRVHEGLHMDVVSAHSADAPAGRADHLAIILDSAWVQAFYYNDAAAARATVKRALAAVPMESLAPADRPWQQLVLLAAAMHDGPAARGYDTSLERDLPTTKFASVVGYKEAVRGVVAIAESHPKDAIPLLQTAYKGYVGREDTGPWLAQAYDLTNQPDSAIVEFERFVASHDIFLTTQRFFLSGSYKRLGELYEAKGNTAKAVENYQKFIDLWNGADPELQPAVKSAKARLEELKKKGAKG